LSALLATIALALLAGLAFSLATALALALAWPWLRRRLAHAHPALRARAALLACVAPAVLPALLLALCFAPGLLGAVGLADDHCLRHPDHPHLCLRHASAPLTGARVGLLLAAVGLSAATILPQARRLGRSRRWLGHLPRAATRLAPDVEVFDSAVPFSFAAGLVRPRVLLSAGLAAALPAAQLAAVVEHERAHARRRDPLARLVARLLSTAHLPSVRRALLAELSLASEQACDHEAGRRLDDRLAVAEAILAVERLLASSSAPPLGVPAFGGSSVTERVRCLLAPEPASPRPGVGGYAAAAAVLAAFVLADPFHHATEHLLAFLTRWI
jgi:Zn-dependent protease with chaperone function